MTVKSEDRLLEAGREESAARTLLAKARSERVEKGKISLSLANAALDFRNAAELYDQAGSSRKAEANYRLAAQLYHECFSGNPSNSDQIAYVKSRGDDLRSDRVRGMKYRWTAVASVFALMSGAFFISSNVTGNAISNLSNATSSWIGGVLLAIGFIALGFWIGKKKRSVAYTPMKTSDSKKVSKKKK
jgi:hypothetical protein